MTTKCQTYRIEADVTRDGLPYIHSTDNVTASNAAQGEAAWESRQGEGMGFEDNHTGVTWFYFWHEITDVRFIPEH